MNSTQRFLRARAFRKIKITKRKGKLPIPTTRREPVDFGPVPEFKQPLKSRSGRVA